MRAIACCILFLAAASSGCMTFASQMVEPEIYGGLRLAAREIPEEWEKGGFWPTLMALDMPLCIVADTAFLPLTAAAQWSRSWTLDVPDGEDWVLLVRTRETHEYFQHVYFELRRGDAGWQRLQVYRDWSIDGDDVIVDRRSGVRLSGISTPGPSHRRPILALLTGEKAREAIETIDGIAEDYRNGDEERDHPSANGYRLWPGPNSNTFIDRVARETPHLSFEPSHMAVGKDFTPYVRAGGTTTKTGVELETPYLGLQLGLKEGVELHLVGLTLGVSLWPPAVKIPFQSRLGFLPAGGTEPRPLSAERERRERDAMPAVSSGRSADR